METWILTLCLGLVAGAFGGAALVVRLLSDPPDDRIGSSSPGEHLGC